MRPDLIFLVLFLVFFVIHFLIERGLSILNSRYIRAQQNHIPDALQGVISEETYRRSIEYALARARFGHVNAIWSAVVRLIRFSGHKSAVK